MKKYRLILFLLLLSLILVACGKEVKREIVDKAQVLKDKMQEDIDKNKEPEEEFSEEEAEKEIVDKAQVLEEMKIQGDMEKVKELEEELYGEEVQEDIELVGPGNSPANWINNGPVIEYDGYIYYIDTYKYGNLARYDIANSKEELFKEGHFNNINISGDYIFVAGTPFYEEDLPYGIYMYGLKDDSSSFTDISNPFTERVVLYDDYFYFDSGAGQISRIKHRGQIIEPVIDMHYALEFAIFNDKIYFEGSEKEEDNFGIFEADLDGSNLKKIIENTSLGLSMANGYIFYSKSDINTYNMHSYNLETGEHKHIADVYTYDHTSYDGNTYYYSMGKKMDKSDRGIFVADANNENSKLLFQNIEAISFVMEDKYVFQYENEGDNKLIMMDLDGQIVKVLTRFKR